MPLAVPPEIQDMVDNAAEALHVDLKVWHDLTDKAARAKIARHLAALCNHGGGYLLFGFNDDGTPNTPHPGDISMYTLDTITDIIDKYLQPAFQCDCFVVTRTADSLQYPVFRVPSHKEVPICSKNHGPNDAKNNPQGIRKAQYYIRVPGPKSVAIETPEQWKDLIRRCVLNDRESLLKSFSSIIGPTSTVPPAGSGSSGPAPSGSVPSTSSTPTPASTPPIPEPKLLTKWHTEMNQRYYNNLIRANHPWPVEIKENYYQLSYRIIEQGGSTQHTINEFREAIRTAGEAVKNEVWTGWSMFQLFSRKEIAPQILVDNTAGIEIECFETNHLGNTVLDTTVPDFWRITLDGRATICRPYREDRIAVPHLEHRGLGPGKWFSPRILIREAYEVASHAREMLRAFDFAQTVEFRCSWRGLKGRQLAEFDPGIDWHDHISRVDERTATALTASDDLIANTGAIAAKLASPVLRLFDGFEVTTEWVEKLRPGFREI